MDQLTEKKPAEKPAKRGPREMVLAALAARQEAASVIYEKPAERAAALGKADRDIARAIREYDHDEVFDPAKEPVMAHLAGLAARRHVGAVRLLLASRTRMVLPESGDKEKPWGPAYVGWNDVTMEVPRNKNLTLPDPIAEILAQSQA